MATYWQNRKNKDKHNKRRKDRRANDSDYKKREVERSRKYRAKKKAERQGVGTLDAFLK